MHKVAPKDKALPRCMAHVVLLCLNAMDGNLHVKRRQSPGRAVVTETPDLNPPTECSGKATVRFIHSCGASTGDEQSEEIMS